MQANPSSADYKELYEQQVAVNAALAHELRQLKKLIYGAGGERFVPS